jgi:hypothetical protein
MAGRNGIPASIEAQTRYAPSVSMAPWPMLMTPIRPKMIANPTEVSASVSVSNDASIATLINVDDMRGQLRFAL